ncbi:MAG: 4Fe-4S binding protein, partial [Deltaproteobacteria bacterium]|nr:4Fe-4S binding protein [Deltaproteobacteria bacterium]
CRALVKAAEIPLLEPASVAEAKEMARVAFDLSEKLKLPVLIRATTRICHSSGAVRLGPIAPAGQKAEMGPQDRFITHPLFHPVLKKKLAGAAKAAEASPFNRYTGPAEARRLIIASGVGAGYAQEAIASLGLADQVGLLKLGATFPLPARLILDRLQTAEEVVFFEETDPFIEEGVMVLAAQHGPKLGPIRFHGQGTGEVAGAKGPGVGELTPEIVVQSLSRLFGVEGLSSGFDDPAEALALLGGKLPKRELTFCAGCPHRASFWAMRRAIKKHDQGAIVLGDIGCYTLALARTGFHVLQTTHCMGGGLGLANGLGQLGRFGLTSPVVAVLGDSTFFHAGLPALINAKHQQANFLAVILDNLTTAMTGGQPHPGRPTGARGETAEAVEMESLIKGLGLPMAVQDPYDISATTQLINDLLAADGPRVLILRRECSLRATKAGGGPRMRVDPERCDGCGLCSREFACPANVWDEAEEKAFIDPTQCTGCGVCAQICPQGAILVEGADES